MRCGLFSKHLSHQFLLLDWKMWYYLLLVKAISTILSSKCTLFFLQKPYTPFTMYRNVLYLKFLKWEPHNNITHPQQLFYVSIYLNTWVPESLYVRISILTNLRVAEIVHQHNPRSSVYKPAEKFRPTLKRSKCN